MSAKPEFPRRPIMQRAPLAVSAREAADLLGVSYSHFRRHILCELKIIRTGQRLIVPVGELEAWLRREAEPVLPEDLARTG